MFPCEQDTACAFKPSVTALNCKEQTESTSGTSRLNSSKHPQAPEDAKPGVSERCGEGSEVIVFKRVISTRRSKRFRTYVSKCTAAVLTMRGTTQNGIKTRLRRSKPPLPFHAGSTNDDLTTFENVAEALVVHLGRTVEHVAALPETGSKVLRGFGFTRARWTCRGTPHLQMQRLAFESKVARRAHDRKSQVRKRSSPSTIVVVIDLRFSQLPRRVRHVLDDVSTHLVALVSQKRASLSRFVCFVWVCF